MRVRVRNLYPPLTLTTSPTRQSHVHTQSYLSMSTHSFIETVCYNNVNPSQLTILSSLTYLCRLNYPIYITYTQPNLTLHTRTYHLLPQMHRQQRFQPPHRSPVGELCLSAPVLPVHADWTPLHAHQQLHLRFFKNTFSI